MLNVGDGDALLSPCRSRATTSRSIGDNGKMLIFPLAELPGEARGKGVKLQRYKDGGLADLRTLERPRA